MNFGNPKSSYLGLPKSCAPLSSRRHLIESRDDVLPPNYNPTQESVTIKLLEIYQRTNSNVKSIRSLLTR